MRKICKYYNQKVSGKKSEIIYRLYNFCRLSASAIIIQKIYKGHGCECEDEYIVGEDTDQIKKIKHSCTKWPWPRGEYWTPWCYVKGKCGKPDTKREERWWDWCTSPHTRSFFSNKSLYSDRYLYDNLKGIFIYVIIFVLTIPTILYRSQKL